MPEKVDDPGEQADDQRGMNLSDCSSQGFEHLFFKEAAKRRVEHAKACKEDDFIEPWIGSGDPAAFLRHHQPNNKSEDHRAGEVAAEKPDQPAAKKPLHRRRLEHPLREGKHQERDALAHGLGCLDEFCAKRGQVHYQPEEDPCQEHGRLAVDPHRITEGVVGHRLDNVFQAEPEDECATKRQQHMQGESAAERQPEGDGTQPLHQGEIGWGSCVGSIEMPSQATIGFQQRIAQRQLPQALEVMELDLAA